MPDHPLYNDKELLLKIADRDEKAFTILYHRHYAQVYYIAKRMINEDIAKDVVIEVFTKLWESRMRFESNDHLISFLRKMTRNDCIDRLRRMKVEEKNLSDLLNLSEKEYEEVYFKDLLKAHLYHKISQEVEKLPAHLRSIFKLAWFEGLKNGEIAERLSIRDSSVRVGKAEAIRKLRLTLKSSDLLIFLMATHSAKNFFQDFT